ncbi:hypothetical protein JOM56_009937 [Amanita muscaria]
MCDSGPADYPAPVSLLLTRPNVYQSSPRAFIPHVSYSMTVEAPFASVTPTFSFLLLSFLQDLLASPSSEYTNLIPFSPPESAFTACGSSIARTLTEALLCDTGSNPSVPSHNNNINRSQFPVLLQTLNYPAQGSDETPFVVLAALFLPSSLYSPTLSSTRPLNRVAVISSLVLVALFS